MIANTKLIEWLFENRTSYFISKHVDMTKAMVYRYSNGNKEIDSMSLKNAIQLTELAKKERKK